MKDVIKGFLAFALITVNIMWAAQILLAIWRGADFYMVTNSVIAATCYLLMWLMVRRIEALSDSRREWMERARRLEEHIKDLQKAQQKADKCLGCNNVKGCVTCVDGSEWAHIEEY